MTTSDINILYMATNTINGKRYIGVTSRSLKERILQHKLKPKNRRQTVLSRAADKYGWENIKFEIVATFPTYKEALDAEREWIGRESPEYNQTDGGEGVVGFKYSPELLVKRGLRPSPLKGKPRPKEVIEKMRSKLSGRKMNLSPENRKLRSEQATAMGKANMGRTASPHQREVASKMCSETKRKPVVCKDDELEFVSIVSAAKYYGIDFRAISDVARGRIKRTKGKAFAFLEEA